MTTLELIARLRDKGIRISMRAGELELDAPKGALDEELRAELVQKKPELLRLLSWSRRSSHELPLERADRQQFLPLSWAQQRLWFLDQLEPGSSAYNISWTVRLQGELDVSALQAAFDQLVARHESLRTTFPDQGGTAYQQVAPELQVPISTEEMLGVADEQLRARLGKLAARPFDLAAGPLMRLALLRVTDSEHILLVVIHHIVADGASMRVLFRELAALYEARLAGRAAGLPELPVQYADYAVWQRNWLDGTELQRQTDYWSERLQGLPPLLELPWDRPRAAAMRYRGASVLRVLPPNLAEDLRALGRGNGSTLFMVMLSAFYLLLLRYSGRDDLVVGTPMGGRPRTELEGLIGFFINTVVLRANLDGDPQFTELLRQVRSTALDAHANQELPFEKLVEVLQPERELSYSPIFQVMFDLQEEPRWRLPVRNLEVVPEVVFSSRTSSFDLTLSVRQAENGLDAMFEYDTDLFDESSIEEFASHYQALLEQIVADPTLPISQYSLNSAAEQEQIVATWSSVAEDYPAGETLHGLFEQRVTQQPAAIALQFGDYVLSYEEFNRRANRLAHRLQASGAEPGQPVGIIAARQPETFVALLAVLKAGACALPLDPDYPPARRELMLRDASARLLLVPPELQSVSAIANGARPDRIEQIVMTGQLFDGPDYAGENPVSLAGPDDPAYLMYTSGTTGKPKGVALPHRGLVNYVHQLGRRTGLRPADRVLQFASLSFDISIEESFSAWHAGAALVLREPGMNLSADEFMAGCDRLQISWLSVPTAWWHELCHALEQGVVEPPGRLRCVIIGGEKARRDAFAAWQERVGDRVRLFNTYGPTETAIAATWCELTHIDTAAVADLPIGHPLPNVQAWVLDEQLRPLPAGVPGELYIGGVGVAPGYWHQPELSSAAFVPDPFSQEPGARLYRTGDRARYLADGRLMFLGRVDGQLKVRGHRIEPAEIEVVLADCAGVTASAIAVRTAGDAQAGDRRLVAYFTGTAESRELRRELQQLLPAYMVPSAFVRLEHLPLTVNGKLDERALPTPEWSRDEHEQFVAPQTALERQLAGIWSAVLGVDKIGVADNFFALGGHSLLATRVVARIRDELETDLPLRKIFDTPTIAGLAAILELHTGTAAALPLVPRKHNGLLPLSWAQQRLWLLDQLEEHNAAYNLPWAARLRGKLDRTALQAALDQLMARHESLRTSFGGNKGEPVQLVAANLQLPIRFADLRDATVDSLANRLAELAAVPFDLHRAPLIRAHLLRIAGDEHVLLLVLHHIVADGWSVGVLLNELGYLYNRVLAGSLEQSALPQLPVQYADYALWQRAVLSGEELQRQQNYWQSRLADLPPALELPADKQRPPVQSYNGAWVSVVASPELLAKLQQLATEQNATLFMLLLAVFKSLLAIQTGREDMVVGTPIAGRQRVELEGLIGCFLNTLVLRTQLAGNPRFSELLERIKETTLGAYEHQALPFELLLDLLQPERSTAHPPLAQVLFNLHNAPASGLRLDGLAISGVEVGRDTAKFDLSATLAETAAGLRIGFEYNTDLFAPATVSDWLDQYVTMLQRVAANPHIVLGDLVRTRAPVLPLPQQRGEEFPAAVCAGTLHARFAEIAARYADHPAVDDGRLCWSYRELDAHSNAVAHQVRALTGGQPAQVGLLLGHDAPMVAGLLGVLRAGCTYVPLDPRAPLARLQKIVVDADVSLLVCAPTGDAAELARNIARDFAEKPGRDELPVVQIDLQVEFAPSAAGEPMAPACAPDDLAYILFTSGSTGTPKGVMQTHRNVLHHARVYSNALGINAQDRLTLLSNYCYDAAVMDIFGALLNGACLQPVDVLGDDSPERLHARIATAGVSILHATPTVFRYLLADAGAEDRFAGIRAVVLGGEEATARDFNLYRRHFPPTARFVNGLGPSESTTAIQYFASHDSRLPGGVVPVGSPVAGMEIELRDAAGNVSGICGELCLRSRYVSSGYWQQPELTAERFGEHYYRTADRARYLPDGQLVYAGRLDDQLKLRGHRVEPGEVEAALLGMPGVTRCAVYACPGPLDDADRVLVAYLQGSADSAAVRAELQKILPGYMLPAAIELVSDWPLLANGKLDRRQLPEPDWGLVAATGDQEPRTAIEKQLHDIWCDLLGQERIDLYADFFSLGGHSLLATRVLSRVRDALGVSLSLRSLFANPTIAALSELLQSATAEAAGPALLPRMSGELPPLSWAQQRLWFLDQLEPDSAAYNLHWAAEVRGEFDTACLQSALHELVMRHESLRTVFGGADSEPVQLIAPAGELRLVAESLSGAAEERVHARLLELIRQPFDLQTGPLLRVFILRTADDRNVLLLVMHHIVSDGWSMGVLFRELAALYNAAAANEPVTLPDLPVQYADYALWQRAWLSGGELERQERYWQAQLADAPPLLELPFDHQRPPVQRYRGAWVSDNVAAELTGQLRELAARNGATLFMVLLTAFKTVILRHTGREDILVGAPIAGRRRTELEGLIGYFLNTLVLRSDWQGNPSFSEALARVQETTLGAYDHQELPFEKLLEMLQPARSTAYTPVVQVTFNLHNEPGGSMQLAGAELTPFKVDRGTAKFDLSVAVVESSDGLQVGFEYNTDLFERATVAELLRHFGEVLSAAVDNADMPVAEIPLTGSHVAPQPQHEFLPFPPGQADGAGENLIRRFAEVAGTHAARTAIVDASGGWSYAQLDAWSNMVAARLTDLVKQGAHVGLLLGHDAGMVAGLLGVLKAGCAYVPLDPDAPPARNGAIIAAAGIDVVVSAPGLQAGLAAEPAVTVVEIPIAIDMDAPQPRRAIAGDDLAYILFTSGSTGQPKGVLQTHRNVLHHVRTYTNALRIRPEDSLTLFSTYGFDASVMDIFGALLNGACLYPLYLRDVEHPGEMLDRLSAITVLHATPTVFRFLMRHKVCRHDLSDARAVVLGGEEARASDFVLFKRHFAPPALFVNGLGPTESTLTAQFFADHSTLLPGQVVPVGSAVNDTEIVLLDEAGAPAGVSGEIAVRSRYVSTGYWQQPQLNAEKFTQEPDGKQPGARLYRTGDRARRLPDGQLVYLGRSDGQLKVRGHRIEPGEIEAQLLAIDAVERCVVVAHSDTANGDQAGVRLVAYVVPGETAAVILPPAPELRRTLRAVLPDYMVPQAFVVLDELPLLPNGKVDRNRLPEPEWQQLNGDARVPPRTDLERQLAGIWTDVLGVTGIGIHDDFFELGGHSLMAAQLVARVTESMQVGLPLRRLFDTPTIAGLAEHVDTLQWALRGSQD